MRLLAQAAGVGSDLFGQVQEPTGAQAFDTAASGNIGLLVFISHVIQVGTVIAGLWVLANFLLAGFDYITGGDKGASGAKDKMTNSVIGIAIIVAAYTIAGLIGLLFFGDASYILNPKICGPSGCGG